MLYKPLVTALRKVGLVQSGSAGTGKSKVGIYLLGAVLLLTCILVGYVVAGVILSAAGLYQPIAEFAGAGATVPLTGFGHLLATGVREAINEDGLLGIFTGGLKACAGGITAAVCAGLISGFLFKAKDRS